MCCLLLSWMCLKLCQVTRGRELSCLSFQSPLSKFPDKWWDPTSSAKIPLIATSLIVVYCGPLFNFCFGSKLVFICPSGANESSDSLNPVIFIFSCCLLALECRSTLMRGKISELFQMLFVSVHKTQWLYSESLLPFLGRYWGCHLTVTHSTIVVLWIGAFSELLTAGNFSTQHQCLVS